MGKLELQQCVLGPVYTNCYIAKNKETGEALIIDPADSPSKIELKVNAMGARPVAVLLTHGHFDHIMGVEAVREKYQIPVYACRQEEEMLREPSVNMTDQMGKSCSIRPDVFLDDLQVFEAAGFSIQMIHTPGHTKGKLLLLSERGRRSVQRRYSVLRLCRQDRFSGRKCQPDPEQPAQTVGRSAG